MPTPTAAQPARLPLLPATEAAMWAYNDAVRYGGSKDRDWIEEKRLAYQAARDVDPVCIAEDAAEAAPAQRWAA